MDNLHAFKADTFKQFRQHLCDNLQDYKNILVRYLDVDSDDRGPSSLVGYLRAKDIKKLKKADYVKIAKIIRKLNEEELHMFLSFHDDNEDATLERVNDLCVTDCTE